MTSSNNNYGRNDPLHGVTLKAALTELVEFYGWEGLARRIRINCFANDPSLNSSLTFLRRTPWARDKVEQLFVQMKQQSAEAPEPTHSAYSGWQPPN